MTSPSSSSIYHKKFLDVLTSHSILIKDQWQYIGGDTGRHLTKFRSLYPDKTIPHEDRCICGHDIVENCYIENIYNDKILVVGNCCIVSYLQQDTSKKCETCEQPHNNRMDNYCNQCRGGILRIGKYKDNPHSYQWICDNDISYCRWAFGLVKDGKQVNGELLKFILWMTKDRY